MEEYCYLLDNQLQIPKSAMMTNELIIKILYLASKKIYSQVGKPLFNGFTLSKSTIWKAIKDILLKAYYADAIIRNGGKIYIQIDEKFIAMTTSKNKKNYYTLTIFEGKEINKKSCKLLNKTVLGSYSLTFLKAKLNDILINRYKVSVDEEIYVSGDFATHIEKFGNSIIC